MSQIPPDAAPTGRFDYLTAVDYLLGRIDYERRPAGQLTDEGFRLGRMRTLLGLVGDPHRIPAVHIAGTKGKGSTAAMVAAMLTASGIRTGLFTSPHLTRIEERFRVDGELISEAEFLGAVERLASVIDPFVMSADGFLPTFFEMITLLGWIVFRDHGCERVVLEVGLGGRLDTTVHCEPLVTLITNISRDHTQLLGETLPEIAREKAGIIKPNIPLLTAVDDLGALAVITEIATERQAPISLVGTNLFGREESNDHLRVESPWGTVTVPVPLPGEHQRLNATLAASTLLLLARDDRRITEPAMVRGMTSVRWPLRIETLRERPRVIVDAAHNGASTAALARTISEMSSTKDCRKILIFGTSRDKHADEMLPALATAFDEIILTRFGNNPRAVEPNELRSLAEASFGDAVRISPSVTEAWRQARNEATPNDLIVATGSFFLAAEFRELLLAETS